MATPACGTESDNKTPALVCCRECIRLVNELGLPVEVIMLPSFAYEHKVFMGPFSRRYPQAQVPVGPNQGNCFHSISSIPHCK